MTKNTEETGVWLFTGYRAYEGKLVALFAADIEKPEETRQWTVKRGRLSSLSPASLYEVTFTGKDDVVVLTTRGDGAPRWQGGWGGNRAAAFVALSEDAERLIKRQRSADKQRRLGMGRFDTMTLGEAKALCHAAGPETRSALIRSISRYLQGYPQ